MREMLSILLSELFETIQKSKFTFVLSIIALATTSLMIHMTIDSYLDSRLTEANFIAAYGDENTEIYRIILDGDMDVFDRIFWDESNAMNRMRAFEGLKNHPNFDYRYSVVNPIYFFDEIPYPYHDPEMVIHDGLDFLAVHGIYADNLFIYQPNVIISEGTGFSEEDFFIHDRYDKSLPVILGSGYRSLYELGDVIEQAHLASDESITLTVIGFLEEGSHFFINNGQRINLNYYMIVPSPEIAYSPILADGSYDPFFLLAYDAFKLQNGLIVFSQENRAEILESVRKIFNDNHLYELSLWSETAESLSIVEALRQQTSDSLQLTVFILFLTICMLGVQSYYKVLRNRKKYSTFVMTGMNKKQVRSLIGFETVGVLIFANSIFFFITNYLVDRRLVEDLSTLSIITLVAFQLLVIALRLFIGHQVIYKLNMSSILRQKE